MNNKFNSREVQIASSSLYYDEEEAIKLFKIYDGMIDQKVVFDGMFDTFIQFYKNFNDWDKIADKNPEDRKSYIVNFILAYANEIPNSDFSESFILWINKVVSTNVPMELADDVLNHWTWDNFKNAILQVDKSSVSFKDKLAIRPNFIENIDDGDIVSFDDIPYTAITNSKYTTGLNELDTVVHLVDTNFIIIAARPGVGKSLFMLHQAIENASNGYKCLYISLEMGDAQIDKRVINHYAGFDVEERFRDEAGIVDVNACAMQYENIKNEDRYKTICKNMQIYNPKTNNAESILAKVENYIKKYNYNIIFIDYLQLLRYSRLNEWESLRATTAALKSLARINNVLVVSASQVSRSSVDRSIDLSDLFGSSSIENDTDVVIGLENYRDRTQGSEAILNVKVLKNREGDVCELKYKMDYAIGQMTINDIDY